MEKSRTKNSIKNVSVGMISQMINKLMAFFVRTIFIHTLNSEYLGVNGLFTNILSILSFTELGIGTAIIYSMYKPIANNDESKIKGLMKLYKKCYIRIGYTVFLLGLCVIPFMSFIIKDMPNIKENIYFIYVLFLLDTSCSYFFSYKKSIISAYQQERVINKINSIFKFIISILQVIFLMLTKNFIVYLLIQITMNMLENFYISRKANKMFPFLIKGETTELDKIEKKSIFSNVKSLVIYKFGSTILSSTDNIIISSMMNVSTVGLCSNYTLLIESIRSLLLSSFNGITASIGNLNATADNNKKVDILYQYLLINFWIYSIISILFVVLLNPFIKIWLGNNYLLSELVPISLTLSFWILGMRTPIYVYRITMGVFNKGKLTPLIASILNIIFSILLGLIMGVSGIFFATSIAQIFSYCIIDPYIIYKYELKKPSKEYFLKQIKYLLLFVVVCIISFQLCSFISLNNQYLLFMVKGLISIIIPNIIFYIFLRNTKEFSNVKVMLKNNLKKSKK